MEVRALGVLEVVSADGTVIPLKGAKLRALTTLLALDAGRVVSSDRLIDALYGETLPRNPDNALQVLISKLRRALRAAGDDTEIVARAPGYVLNISGDDVDLTRVEAMVTQGRSALLEGRPADAARLLRDALALWRGPALAEFANEDFAAGERARLDELRVSAIEDRIDADLALGRHVECAGELEQHVADHPLRERAWERLMLALYRSGRQAEALRAYQEARRQLGDELGLEPGPELRRLEAAILVQAPSLDLLDGPVGRPVVETSRSPGNLARPLTSCIGRAEELEAVEQLMQSHRLVTLVGPGGTGKTRLAIEVGLEAMSAAGIGTWMVDLSPVAGPDGVVPAFSKALGLPDSPAAGAASAIAAALADRAILLVVDNCEHVVDETARLVEELLTRCEQVKVLATSREGLGVSGEMLFAVSPLEPEAAVELFTERATAAAPGLLLDEPAWAAVGDICARLDGLPLAIELAASRARAFDVTQIATRLNDRFRLLTGGARTALARHRTLRAAVEWSYDLLEPEERLVFQRFSVFADGATLDAVERVLSGDGVDDADVSDVVVKLVDKSLVTVSHAGRATRYSMLQTLMEYAGERLEQDGDSERLRRRHAEWMRDVVRAADRGGGHRPTVSVVSLQAELGNLDAAFAWTNIHEPLMAFDMAARLGWFWLFTGRVDVGWRILGPQLDRLPAIGDDVLARALAWGGVLSVLMGDQRGPGLLESAVEHGRRSENPVGLGSALGGRAVLATMNGRTAEALADLTEALACFEQVDDAWGQSTTEMVIGTAAMAEGRFADAEGAYTRSAEHARRSGESWAAGVLLHRLAEIAERQGHYDEAAIAAEEALAVLDDPGHRLHHALSIRLASVRLGQGHLEEARAVVDLALSRCGPGDVLAVAAGHHVRGRIGIREGRFDEARRDLETALERYQQHGDVGSSAACLGALGQIANRCGDYKSASAMFVEAVRVALQTTDQTVTLSAVEGMVVALAGRGEGSQAGVWLGAADALRQAGATPWDLGADDRAVAETGVRALVEPGELAALRAQGAATSLAQLVGSVGKAE